MATAALSTGSCTPPVKFPAAYSTLTKYVQTLETAENA